MKRFGQVIRLRSGALQRYKMFHTTVWPEVSSMITECHIHNFTIWHKDGFLFCSFEYHGCDYRADMARMATDPKTQEWWSIMEPLQEPLETREVGEWWAIMEECYHQD